jgi:hypothetical protein
MQAISPGSRSAPGVADRRRTTDPERGRSAELLRTLFGFKLRSGHYFPEMLCRHYERACGASSKPRANGASFLAYYVGIKRAEKDSATPVHFARHFRNVPTTHSEPEHTQETRSPGYGERHQGRLETCLEFNQASARLSSRSLLPRETIMLRATEKLGDSPRSAHIGPFRQKEPT